MTKDQRDIIVARMLYQDGKYWLFHKNFIDENAETVLEKKPEEKVWRVVKEIRQSETDQPAYKLQKKDLIKVGRVRFKIRDIMSAKYRDIESGYDTCLENHREIYPSIINESLSSSVLINNESH